MKHKDIARAWLDGAEVEFKTHTGEWHQLNNVDACCSYPAFHDMYEYRIKPVQTPCEKLGYKVGDLFLRYVQDGHAVDAAVVRLAQDDGTDLPPFDHVAGGCYQPGQLRYCDLSTLTKFVP